MVRSCLQNSHLITCAQSAVPIPTPPNPNCRIARITRPAFTALARRKKSMSAEYRGKPCQEAASAPTTRYSTSFEFKHSINSRKSLLIGIGERSFPYREKYLHPFLRSHPAARQRIRFIGFLDRIENADRLVHPSILSPLSKLSPPSLARSPQSFPCREAPNPSLAQPVPHCGADTCVCRAETRLGARARALTTASMA